MKVSRYVYFLMIVVLLMQCRRIQDYIADQNISIDFPLNKKAVYAIGTYFDYGDSTTLQFLEIASLQFDSTYTAGDTLYLDGQYASHSDNNRTPISVAFINDWILFEYSESMSAGEVFLKPKVLMDNDTTALPDRFHNHFAVAPQTMESNAAYTIVRPENYGDEWGYLEVVRTFDCKYQVEWADGFGSASGMAVTVTHELMDFNHTFHSIFDEHGLLNSQWSFETELTTQTGEGIRDILVHRINRRIVDYSDPSEVGDLKTYHDLVRKTGMKIVGYK